ncbi:hypothetical protein EDD17DRAFT_1621523, partial [Pisolithus thermaeus]
NLPRGAGQICSCQVSILDTLHVSFMCHTLYYYLVTNYGVPTSLEYIAGHTQYAYPLFYKALSWTFQLLVVVMVQLFFAHKIYRLCRRGVRWLVTAPILLFILAHYGKLFIEFTRVFNDVLTGFGMGLCSSSNT